MFIAKRNTAKQCRRLLGTSLQAESFLSIDEVKKFPICHLNLKKHLEKEIEYTRLVGVTTILGKTKPLEDQLVLARWKKKQILLMGEEQFNKMQQATLNQGIEVHAAIGSYLSGEAKLSEIKVSKEVLPLWNSVQHVLRDITDVHMIEGEITHPQLGYRGYIDCVAKYKGDLCVIDWKTSKKKRKSLLQCYDDPVQIAAYTGAYNYTYKQVKKGLVVKLYYNGENADVFQMNSFNIEYNWYRWLERLAKFYYK